MNFVCLFVWNLYKSTFLNRSEPNFAHVSPWSGGGRRVYMDSQYFNYPTFSAYFVRSECRFVRGRWLPAPVPS